MKTWSGRVIRVITLHVDPGVAQWYGAMPAMARSCELATLGPGDAFGEEALLSDSPRNSTVTMLQDGEVLRLSKQVSST